MTITLSVFAQSPDRGRGLARDMGVRWALEEAGLPYEVRLVSFAAMKEPAHLARQPFGQIPSYEENGLVLFESGAIVLHVAERAPALLPDEPHARAQAIAWIFAALSTLEPPVVEFTMAALFEKDQPWYEARQPMLETRLRARLGQLDARLGDDDWLGGSFSAGDLMTITVLRRLGSTGLLADYPRLAAYVARGEARPAFQRAFAAQLAVFTRSQAASG
ncbi:MAG: glutathione S-transferase family protein [Novosphingobium sp.]|nr:glutathione S-transferase family protein [Novosphingobium sp.]